MTTGTIRLEQEQLEGVILLEQWSYIADVIGVILIIASLVYMARQLRQNTDAQLATSRQAMLAADLDLLSKSIDYPEAARGLGTSPDEVRHASWIISYLRVREFAWYQYRNRILDQTTWESYIAPTAVVFESPESRAVLDAFTANREFVTYMKGLLSDG